MKRILLLTLFLILLTSCTPQEEEDFQIPFPDEISKCSILTIKFEKPEMINGRMEIESPYGLFNISPFKKEQGIAFRFTPEQRGI